MMLTITDRAGVVLRATLRAAEKPTSAIRLSPAEPLASQNGTGKVVRLDVVDVGLPDDEILEAPGGAPIFVDADVAPWVADKVLDASIDDRGHTSLLITDSDDEQ